MAVTEASHAASRAVDALYRQHGGEIYRYAYAVLGNHADAEDVTQTTFLNAYRAFEQGVRPRKPSNWLLTIASNAIKQRFRREQARPRHVEFDERIAGPEPEDDDPSIGELLTALSKIPPQQRQALVLREFEGRTYAEIAAILGVTRSALETLLFRARRSLAEELEQRLTCTEAQLAVSKSVDGRLGRKQRRRLRDHLAECPDCAHFARLQPRHRRALQGLMLIPIPFSLSIFKGLDDPGTASAATMPVAGGEGASSAATSTGVSSWFGAAGTAGGSSVAGGVAIKAAAVVAAVTIVGGVAVVGAVELGQEPDEMPYAVSNPSHHAARAVLRGVAEDHVAHGQSTAPGRMYAASNVSVSARSAQTPVAKLHDSTETEGPSAKIDYDGGTEGDTDSKSTQPGPQGDEPQRSDPQATDPQATDPPGDEPQGAQPQADEPPGMEPPVLQAPTRSPSQAPKAEKQPKNPKKPNKVKKPKKPARHEQLKPGKQPKPEHQPTAEKEPKPEHQPKAEKEPKLEEPKAEHQPKPEAPQTPNESFAPTDSRPGNDKGGGSSKS